MIDVSLFDGEMRLANVNLRSERHGDADVPAVDIKLEWVTSNETLRGFHPRMRESFYEPDKQLQLDGFPEAQALVFPDLDPIKVHSEESGLSLRIVHGLSGSSDLVLKDCTASGFVLELMQGGSVEITFRMSTVDIDEKRLGKLAMMLKGSVPVRIERQNPPDEGETEDAGESEPAKTPRKKRSRESAPAL